LPIRPQQYDQKLHWFYPVLTELWKTPQPWFSSHHHDLRNARHGGLRQRTPQVPRICQVSLGKDCGKYEEVCRPQKSPNAGLYYWPTRYALNGQPLHEQTCPKFTDKWTGPFEILEKLGELTYKLTLPDQWSISPTFHVDKLRPCHQDPLHPNHPRPPPDLVNKEEEYEVKKILESKYRWNTLHYLVKWVGYLNSENIWVRADKAEHMKDLITDWHKFHPDSPSSLKPTRKLPSGPRKPTRKTKVWFLGMESSEPVLLSDIPWKKRDTTEVNPIAWPTGQMTSQTIFVVDKLKVQLLSPTAKLPIHGSELAAGYDLSSAQELVIPPGGQSLVRTDISISIPKGTYGRIAPRSGLALKHTIGVHAGVIDADYTGAVGVLLYNHGQNAFTIKTGDHITQLILERIATPKVVKVQKLSNTKRGSDGFGSTGTSTHPNRAIGSGPSPSL